MLAALNYLTCSYITREQGERRQRRSLIEIQIKQHNKRLIEYE